MKITIVTPAPPGSRVGNRITALRWARILRKLGHRVGVEESFLGERCDLFMALHARRSSASIQRFAEQCPESPLVVGLTGTDLYNDIAHHRSAQKSLQLAWRLVVLQSMGVAEVPQSLKSKVRVIYQSVPRPTKTPPPRKGVFEVCVLGHLRSVKDPFRTALAARQLPTTSKIQVLHLGAALTETMRRRALKEQSRNPRYRWLGELPRWRALRVLARSRLLVLTSKMEGGANAISEALAHSVPVLASRISGSLGMLGAHYPGFYPTGNTAALAQLLESAETEATFYRTLKKHCRKRAALVRPAREQNSWKKLIEELFE
ncbi:MAG: selenoneine biosynthesis selenosugar synthase SenB [Planctomycetota bacterium]